MYTRPTSIRSVCIPTHNLQITHHIRFPQRLAHAVHLFIACAAHNKVIRLHGAANEIHGSDVGLGGDRVQAGDHGLNEVGAEAAIRQRKRCFHNVSYCFNYLRYSMPVSIINKQKKDEQIEVKK